MPACVAYGCTNRTTHKSKQQQGLEETGIKITFHRLPKNPIKNQLWIKAIRRKDWQPSKSSILCSMHFVEQDFDRTSLSVVRLRENAVPSVFKAFPSYLQVTKSKRKSPLKRKQNASPVTSTSQVSPVTETVPPSPVAITSHLEIPSATTTTKLPNKISLGVSSIPKTVTRYTSVSPQSERRFVLPSKQLMRQAFKNKRQQYIEKIKTLQKIQSRNKRTITDLKKVLCELKSCNLLSEYSYKIIIRKLLQIHE